MRRFLLPLNISATLFMISLLSGAAQAQAERTWVSSVGDDANPCSRPAPCRTFAGAISKTAAGGEIDALDPGGFAVLTITKGITIDGGGGQVASVLASGTNGITVNALGASDVVTLRNLRINGIEGTGSGGIDGVHFLAAAALHIENCYISGFTGNGINVLTSANSALFVDDTFLTNNGNGIQIAPSGAFVRSTLVRVRAQDNAGYGFLLNPGAGAIGAGTVIDDSSALVNGTAGIGVNGGTLYLGNSVIIGNGFGVVVAGGTVLSYKTNMIDGNLLGNGTPLTGPTLAN
jgi:Right handed beta helix region